MGSEAKPGASSWSRLDQACLSPAGHVARHGDAGVVHKLGQSLVLQPHRQFVPLTAAIPQAIHQELDQGPEPLFRIAEVLDSQQGCGPFREPDRIRILRLD
jgi:hypothetical protein